MNHLTGTVAVAALIFAASALAIVFALVFPAPSLAQESGTAILINIEVDALANMILVDGNPLENIDLIADPDKAFALIMKGGKSYKNTIN